MQQITKYFSSTSSFISISLKYTVTIIIIDTSFMINVQRVAATFNKLQYDMIFYVLNTSSVLN